MKLTEQEIIILSIYEQIDSLEPHQIDESQETIESMLEELWPYIVKIDAKKVLIDMEQPS